MNPIDQLSWRYATKKFDSNKKISDKILNTILESIRLAPTSFGLQPIHVLVITNPGVREKLREVSWGQPQVTESSQLLVFCARTDFDECMDMYCAQASSNSYASDSIEGWRAMVGTTISKLSSEDSLSWATRQAYIALGFGLVACAQLGVDSCPMEGFDALEYSNILSLPESIHPVVVLALGYRSESDVVRAKNRQSMQQLFDFRD